MNNDSIILTAMLFLSTLSAGYSAHNAYKASFLWKDRKKMEILLITKQKIIELDMLFNDFPLMFYHKYGHLYQESDRIIKNIEMNIRLLDEVYVSNKKLISYMKVLINTYYGYKDGLINKREIKDNISKIIAIIANS